VLVREALYRSFTNQGGGRLRRAHAQSLRQRRPASWSGHLQGRQPPPAQGHGGAGLAVATLPARQRPRAVVHRAGWRGPRTHAKITAVALARKLLIAVWRYLTTGLLPKARAW